MAELLVELFSEEIPARIQARAAADLLRLVADGLERAGLAHSEARGFATPRRLVLVVDGLPAKQPDLREERRGPRIDAPEKAIKGFLGSAGLESVDQCERRETDKGTFLVVVTERKGRNSADVLPAIVTEAVEKLSWPKSMRWGTTFFRWVRPLQSILCVFDGKRLEGKLPIANFEVDDPLPELQAYTVIENLEFSNVTQGHRFLAPERFPVTDFADYEAKLKNAKVVLDPAERRATIESSLEKLAKVEGLAVKDDPGLLDEVAGLVEWPVVLLGDIDDAFMSVPSEVLTASMRTHQKYFSLLAKDGSLAPRFGVVANIETADGGKRIVAGNERVLRARLADAKFFWDQDRKATLGSRAPRLEQIVFHAKLGTLDEKVDRAQALAADLAAHVPGADRDRVRSAARLCKADLVTGMVGEFPELQGVMGRYYALNDGEHPEVAEAIAEHYAPLGPNDRCPTAPVSVCVALADKIDTLVGFFAIDEKPTGSRDPYGLRRAALGIIRLIIENQIRVPLRVIFSHSYDYYFSQISNDMRLFSYVDEKYEMVPHGLAYKEEHKSSHLSILDNPNRIIEHGVLVNENSKFSPWISETKLLDELLEFFADRLKVALRDHGVRHDLIAAVFAVDRPGGGMEDDLVRLMARVEALEAFLGSDDGANLLIAYKRAVNIVRIEEKKDKTRYNGGADTEKFSEKEEKALHAALQKASGLASDSLGNEDFTAAMRAMARLRKPVDAFFDHVTVNAEDAALRENRLRLLSAIGGTLNHAADFSKIEG